MTSGQFAGLRVVVTGSAGGIGRATAIAFARGGAELVLCDLDRVGLQRTAQLVEDRGGKTVFAEAVDVANREQMAGFAEAALRAAGGIDVLVNNAGIGAGGSFVTTELPTWDRVLSVNLMGVVHGCHYFLPNMIERGQGHVVNIASVLGLVGLPGVSVYSASKFAVVGLSRSLMSELKGAGILVTAICPGLIATDIMSNAMLSGQTADRRPRIAAAFRRGAPPDRVAQAIASAVLKGKSGVIPVTPFARIAHLVDRYFPGISRYLAAASKNGDLGRAEAVDSRTRVAK